MWRCAVRGVGLVTSVLWGNLSGWGAEPDSMAEFDSYIAHVFAAQASLQQNDTSQARRWLEKAKVAQRGWEWRLLDTRRFRDRLE